MQELNGYPCEVLSKGRQKAKSGGEKSLRLFTSDALADAGRNCTEINPISSIKFLKKTSVPGSRRLVAATGTSGLVYASDDYGKTWFLHGQLPDATNVMSLLQTSKGDLYAGTYPAGIIYKYRDSTEGWKRVTRLVSDDPEPRMFVFDLAESAWTSSAKRIWAATGPGGALWVSPLSSSFVPPSPEPSPGPSPQAESSGSDSG